MYISNDKRIIYDNEQYISANGTKYPKDYPKDEITCLSKVIETEKPTGDFFTVDGFTVDKDNIQVWNIINMSDEEIAERQAEKITWEQGRAKREWQQSLDITDTTIASPANIARFMEDFYDANPAKLAVKPQQFKDTHAERKVLRAGKPV